MNLTVWKLVGRSCAKERAHTVPHPSRLMVRVTGSRGSGMRPSSVLTDEDARAGVRAMLPVVVGYAPFGLVVGATVAASANPLAAYVATWTIYGGAAHLAVLDALGAGAGWTTAALVGLLVNARLSAYATSMAPQWRSASVAQRTVAALMLTDAPWALTQRRSTGRRPFYLGAALTLFVGWPVLVTVGMLAHRWTGTAPVLTLLAALTLGCAVIGQLRQRPAAAAAVAAAVVTIATTSLSTGTALLAAAAAGAATGLCAEAAS